MRTTPRRRETAGAVVFSGHRDQRDRPDHLGEPPNVNNHEAACAGYYSNLSSTLMASPGGSQDFARQLFPLEDTADDAPPDGSRTLSFTLDLGGCLRAAGSDPTGLTVALNVTATGESRPGGVDRTAQLLSVTLP